MELYDKICRCVEIASLNIHNPYSIVLSIKDKHNLISFFNKMMPQYSILSEDCEIDINICGCKIKILNYVVDGSGNILVGFTQQNKMVFYNLENQQLITQL